MNSNPRRIAILQYNLNRCQTTLHSLLNHPDSKRLTILAVQEQYCSKLTKTSLSHPSWTLIEPPRLEADTIPRAAIYINNRILQPSTYETLNYPSSDVVILKLTTNANQPMLIVNIYNSKGTPLINNLASFLQAHLQHHTYSMVAIVGDFNLHHPLWNHQSYLTHDTEAEDLIELMTANGLNLLLPPGTVTYPRAGTTLDLAWGNEQMEQRILKCKVARNHDHGSDHLPIIIVLDITLERTPQIRPFNYERTEWDHLKAKLRATLPPILRNPSYTPTPTTIDDLATNIITALREAIESTTPRRRTSPYSKRW